MRPLILRLLCAWVVALLALVSTPTLAELPARPKGPVLDAAGIIPDAQEAALVQRLSAYSLSTGRAVMVVTVSSLDGEDVATYAVNLGHAWGVGGKTTDQGLILLVAPSERKVRIETGYGLEEYMPDVLASRIIRETITPAFKAGDYPGGITAGVNAIITQLDRDPAEAKAVAEAAKTAAAANAGRQNGETGAGSVVFWLVLILFFMLVFGRRGRRRGQRSGIDPGIILWGISEAMHHSRGSGGGSDWGGFGGSGGGSDWGGFGGSGGGGDWGGFGGGDFGGGGASGDW